MLKLKKLYSNMKQLVRYTVPILVQAVVFALVFKVIMVYI